MLRIQQPVILMRRQRRRHDQDAILAPVNKVVSNPGNFRRCRGASPVRGKVLGRNSLPGHAVGNFRCDQDQVRRRVVGVQMNKVFQHRQRLMLGRVRETSSRARPASAIAIAAFSVERRARISLAQHAVNLRHTVGVMESESTDSAVGDPSQHVFHLARPQLRIHCADGSNSAQRAIGALQPARRTLAVAQTLLCQGYNPCQTV